MVALGVLGKYPISVEFQAHYSANPHSREPVPLTVESIGLRERIRAAIRSQTKSNVNVLSSLHAVLDDLGYVPQEAIEEVAEHMDTTINEVWGVRVLLHELQVHTARRQHSGDMLGPDLPSSWRAGHTGCCAK